jgi:hypothetical protein
MIRRMREMREMKETTKQGKQRSRGAGEQRSRERIIIPSS